MAIFTIIAQAGDNSEKLAPAIIAQFPSDNLYVAPGPTWLVAFKGTAEELSAKLGITDGTGGAAIVLQVASYFGRTNPAIWTWIKTKWEATSGG